MDTTERCYLDTFDDFENLEFRVIADDATEIYGFKEIEVILSKIVHGMI